EFYVKDKIELIMGNRELFDQFLDLTAKSIKTERGCPSLLGPWTTESWPVDRGNMTAEQRVRAWCKSEGVYIYNCSTGILYSGEMYLDKYNFTNTRSISQFSHEQLTRDAVPFFPNIVEKVLKSTSALRASDTINQTKETKQMFKTQSKTV